MGLTVLSALLAALVAVALGAVITAPEDDVTELPLLMPGVSPKKDDTYLCKAFPLEKDSINIIKFKPKAKKEIAHHILIYGCEVPGNYKNNEVWHCGEMNNAKDKPVCQEGSKIIYAWAMDAPSLSLPKDVGFEVGGATTTPFIVLQVHYKNTAKFRENNKVKDYSGVILETTTKPMKHPAGVYLLGTGGELPPHRTVYMETACSYKHHEPIYPFAFRTHTHKHGQVVSGYRVRAYPEGEDGERLEWEEIGRMDPHEPQMFYNVTNPNIKKSGIRYGDILAARCTMKNDDNERVFVGATQKDEMCNFYVMYYTKKGGKVPYTSCFRPGPPDWYWLDFGLRGEPHSASVVPGSNQRLNEDTDFTDFSEFSFLK